MVGSPTPGSAITRPIVLAVCLGLRLCQARHPCAVRDSKQRDVCSRCRARSRAHHGREPPSGKRFLRVQTPRMSISRFDFDHHACRPPRGRRLAEAVCLGILTCPHRRRGGVRESKQHDVCFGCRARSLGTPFAIREWRHSSAFRGTHDVCLEIRLWSSGRRPPRGRRHAECHRTRQPGAGARGGAEKATDPFRDSLTQKQSRDFTQTPGSPSRQILIA